MVACGSATAPSTPAGEIAGAWVANTTLASASGGECVGDALRQTIGGRDIVLTALKQDGPTLSATVTSQGDGTMCAYAGTRTNDAAHLTLTSCQVSTIAGIHCANGSVRSAQLISGTVDAMLPGRSSGSGSQSTIWNVLPADGAAPIATLTITTTQAWVFLGVPSSDYHVFTGTVFPGYADGTITIEGADTFCSPCGWFPH